MGGIQSPFSAFNKTPAPLLAKEIAPTPPPIFISRFNMPSSPPFSFLVLLSEFSRRNFFLPFFHAKEGRREFFFSSGFLPLERD